VALLKMNYIVYVLQSVLKNWHYVGFTNNLKRRIEQHNRGKVLSTKTYKPFRLIFTKLFKNRLLARDYEKFLKIRSNKEKLLKSLLSS